MASVELAGLAKSFHGHAILHQLELEIADKEFLVLVGPSGCGKSTLLRMIAGLEEPTAGEIRIGGRPVTDVPPSKREIAMVFQDYALYPHMTVEQNMSFGLRLRKLPKDQIDRRVRDAARLLQIEPLLSRTPRQLSGGQRQRVAIGRAIVRKPQVFLFDEPLSNLDAKLREEMRVEIAKLHQRLQTTVIYVTHDQVEAMTLATRIAVMNGGRLQQIGSPQEVFNAPANLFVAGFIGSPTMNFIEGRLEPGADRARFTSRAFEVALPRPSPAAPLDAVLGVRPESISVESPSSGYSEPIQATIEVVELLGHRKNVHLRLGDDKLLAVADAAFAGQAGDRVPIWLKTSAAHLFVRESGQRIP